MNFLKNLSDKSSKITSRKLVVTIGGGTGQYTLLNGLKEYANIIDIKSIVTTLDNGGSSGKLITDFGILPPGDIRNCLVALSDETEIISKLFQYRFNDKLKRHSFGNLLITALTEVTGSFEKAIYYASKILKVKGEVIPVSLESNTLIAETTEGGLIVGETNIDNNREKKIKRIKLEKKTKANPRAVEILKRADVILFSPGDLYTSLLPNLLFREITEAINSNRKAKKVLITAVMSKPGETDNFRVSDFKNEVEKYLNGEITHIIANSEVPTSESLREYLKENKYPIIIDKDNLKDVTLIAKKIINDNKIVRHDSEKLAKTVIALI